MAQYFKRENKDTQTSIIEFIKIDKGVTITVRKCTPVPGVLPFEQLDLKKFTDKDTPPNYPAILLKTATPSTENEFNKWNHFFN